MEQGKKLWVSSEGRGVQNIRFRKKFLLGPKDQMIHFAYTTDQRKKKYGIDAHGKEESSQKIKPLYSIAAEKITFLPNFSWWINGYFN